MENLDDKIEPYLDGLLGNSEREQFELALLESPELHERVEMARLMRKRAAEAEAAAAATAPRRAEKAAPARNTWIGGMLIGLGILAAAYIFSERFAEPEPPKDVFAEAFQPPQNLLGDYPLSTNTDTSMLPAGACLSLLAEADAHYQKDELELAQDLLLMVAMDTAITPCKSDAWFFLGILRLKMNDPNLAIQCFTKVEDYERFGDDIQWYMALSFVRIAERDAEMTPRARRALERIRDSAASEERRNYAKELLTRF